jgi:hypothetical protein
VRLNSRIRETAAADTVESYEADADHVHIYEAKVGQTVAEMQCPVCAESMFLQWTANPNRGPRRRFFWTCPNWFRGECNTTSPWTFGDQSVISKEGSEQYSMTSEELNRVALLPESQNHIRKRMARNLRKQADAYECPTHGEPLVLHMKRDAEGLLDMYHFKCPRWKGSQDPASCSYVLKLKSPGQLAEALKQLEGRGIL